MRQSPKPLLCLSATIIGLLFIAGLFPEAQRVRAAPPEGAQHTTAWPDELLCPPLMTAISSQQTVRTSRSCSGASGQHLQLPDGAEVRIAYEGALPDVFPVGRAALGATVNLYEGQTRTSGVRVSPSTMRSAYADLYPGVHLRFARQNGCLKSTYELEPGADPAQIHIRYST